jgi:hypothetical protein
VLCLYWFRRACFIILRDRNGQNYAGRIATANHMVFLRAEALLGGAEDLSLWSRPEAIPAKTLDTLEQSLDRDYRVVMYLLRNSKEKHRAPEPRQLLLSLDFYLMRLFYRALRGISRRRARNAVLEMALIVGYLARSVGERLPGR